MLFTVITLLPAKGSAIGSDPEAIDDAEDSNQEVKNITPHL